MCGRRRLRHPRFFFVSLSIFVSAYAASADSSEKLPKSASGISTDRLEGLDASKKSRIIRLLDSIQFPFTGLIGSEWRRRKGTYLVVLSDTSGGERNSRHAIVAFNTSKPEITVTATSVQPSTFALDDKVDGFDFAPYRMTSSEFAFGVRYSRHRYFATGDASMGGILLCRLKGADIIEIANIPTSYDTNLAGEWSEDGTRDRIMLSGSAVILVTGKKTLGYFDWIKKAEDGKSVRLTWDGNGYILRGKDPFPIEEYAVFNVDFP